MLLVVFLGYRVGIFEGVNLKKKKTMHVFDMKIFIFKIIIKVPKFHCYVYQLADVLGCHQLQPFLTIFMLIEKKFKRETIAISQIYCIYGY